MYKIFKKDKQIAEFETEIEVADYIDSLNLELNAGGERLRYFKIYNMLGTFVQGYELLYLVEIEVKDTKEEQNV